MSHIISRKGACDSKSLFKSRCQHFSGPGRQRQTNKQGNCVEYLENKTTSEERG